MSVQKQQNDNETRAGGPSGPIPFGKKAAYIGSGILIGLIVYPFVRKALGRVQPRMDELLDKLTGKAEDLAEKASDLLARARETLGKGEKAEFREASESDRPAARED